MVRGIEENHGCVSNNREASEGPRTPPLKRHMAAPQENFVANKKQGPRVELLLHHSVRGSNSRSTRN